MNIFSSKHQDLFRSHPATDPHSRERSILRAVQGEPAAEEDWLNHSWDDFDPVQHQLDDAQR